MFRVISFLVVVCMLYTVSAQWIDWSNPISTDATSPPAGFIVEKFYQDHACATNKLNRISYLSNGCMSDYACRRRLDGKAAGESRSMTILQRAGVPNFDVFASSSFLKSKLSSKETNKSSTKVHGAKAGDKDLQAPSGFYNIFYSYSIKGANEMLINKYYYYDSNPSECNFDNDDGSAYWNTPYGRCNALSYDGGLDYSAHYHVQNKVTFPAGPGLVVSVYPDPESDSFDNCESDTPVGTPIPKNAPANSGKVVEYIWYPLNQCLHWAPGSYDDDRGNDFYKLYKTVDGKLQVEFWDGPNSDCSGASTSTSPAFANMQEYVNWRYGNNNSGNTCDTISTGPWADQSYCNIQVARFDFVNAKKGAKVPKGGKLRA